MSQWYDIDSVTDPDLNSVIQIEGMSESLSQIQRWR
jgi:hypothetical protein